MTDEHFNCTEFLWVLGQKERDLALPNVACKKV